MLTNQHKFNMLKKGSSKKVISTNIKKEMKAGKPQNKLSPLLCLKLVKLRKNKYERFFSKTH